MLARNIPKLHHPDPSGFWKLVRAGVELPVPGQVILYVYDIRGTHSELRHELFSLNTGDMLLPQTFTGVVDSVDFDEVLQEHFINLRQRNNTWNRYHSSDNIVYWAPLPTPANTYTPRDNNFDLYYVNGIIQKEQNALDTLSTDMK